MAVGFDTLDRGDLPAILGEADLGDAPSRGVLCENTGGGMGNCVGGSGGGGANARGPQGFVGGGGSSIIPWACNKEDWSEMAKGLTAAVIAIWSAADILASACVAAPGACPACCHIAS